jgi:hypothetical protein
MTNSRITLLAVLFVAAALGGAGCTTSEYSRARAARAVVLLDAYETRQRERIEKLNEEFVKVEAQLRQAHIDELERWTNNDRREDDRQLADAILMQWESRTLPSAVTAEFAQSKEREIARVNKKREDVAAAQKVYQAAYQELAVPLKKVQAAKAAMQKLSQKDASGPSRETFLRILNEVRGYVKEAEAKAEAERKKAKA